VRNIRFLLPAGHAWAVQDSQEIILTTSVQLQNEKLKNWLERFIGLPFRLRHRLRARQKHIVRTDALKTVQKTLQNAARLNAANTTVVFNVGLYVLLLDQDLAFFTDDLVYAIGDHRRAFIAKHEAVLLYEVSKNLPSLLGKNFRDAVKTLGATPDQLQRVNAVSSDLNGFWQREREFLGKIRNVLAAHRVQNALLYCASMEALKPLEVMARGVELSGFLDRLIKTLTEMALLTVGHSAILRDMLHSSKQHRNERSIE
jgi:hypothetical protein